MINHSQTGTGESKAGMDTTHIRVYPATCQEQTSHRVMRPALSKPGNIRFILVYSTTWVYFAFEPAHQKVSGNSPWRRDDACIPTTKAKPSPSIILK
ncbi:MAG: hypothetical protein D5R99_03850 [Methanocalculus sp. MSAO_Arc1]|nr:MAG: hypothetical protein D5R99_03850 [Methanocalculus sp. MSAO_Arc1]